MLLEMPQHGLPQYTVQTSARARHVRIKVSGDQGVVVIIPRGFDEQRIPELLEKRRGWLGGQIERIGEQQKFLHARPENVLPEVIPLTALGETWRVSYKPTRARTVSAVGSDSDQLLVQGAIDGAGGCRAALRRWLSRRTHAELVPWLRELSDSYSLPFGKATVKGQKTRWASCSHRKTLSVNYKLLFLERSLVRYVFLHELCHTVYMHHGERYWALLRSIEPDYKPLHEGVRNGWRQVPAWVDACKPRFS